MSRLEPSQAMPVFLSVSTDCPSQAADDCPFPCRKTWTGMGSRGMARDMLQDSTVLRLTSVHLKLSPASGLGGAHLEIQAKCEPEASQTECESEASQAECESEAR